MDDSHPGRGTPVLSDPWVKAHTPTMDPAAPSSTMDRKKRRAWFTGGTPVKSAAPNAQRRLEEHKEEEVATLQITHFTKKVMLSFDDVRLGSTRTLTLRLENPHDYPQEVELERFPFEKGFSVPDTVWEIEGSQSLDVLVTWTPSEEKNVRELVTFKCEGSFRLQLIILGTVKVPKKKKNVNRRSTFTARKGQVIQSRRSVAVTNPRRETFVQKRSPRSQPYPDVGKENKDPVVGENKVETPRTRKARARSMGTVLERILTPRKVLPQGEVERVMVGDKVCTFSPQLTAKAIMEIAGESPFADGKIQTEPRKDTLVLCDGMSPLLQTTGKQDLLKIALEKEMGPLRRLSKEQTSTVTKSSSPESRLSDENGVEPHRLAFLEPDEEEISKIFATPASSVFEPLGQSVGARLSSTRIDDSVNPAPGAAPLFLAEEEGSPSSMEDDSLDGAKLQAFEVLTDDKLGQNDDLCLTDDVQECGDEDRAEIGEPGQQDVEELIVQDVGPEEKTQPCDTVFKSDLDTMEGAEASDKLSKLPEPSTKTESLYPADEKDGQNLSLHVPEAVQKMQSWRISLDGSGPATSPKEAPRIQKPKPKQEASSWRVSLGSSKRSPGATPVAQKRTISRVASKPATKTSAPPSMPSTSSKTNGDFTIHKSAVTGRLNRKRLSDPISEPAVPKKSRPSPEHKASTRETLRSKNAAANKSGASLSTSRFNRTVALRKAAATGKAVPAQAPASAKSKGKPKPPRAVKGVPMAKLQLIKPSRSALPRHPLPFAAKNIFYDERWMEKQDRAFTCWLNYVLTPDIDTPKDPNKNVKIDAHLLCLEGASKVGPAPTREDLSLRAYTARRRLNRLRRGACLVFQSEPVIRVMQKLEAEVEKGRIVVRSDKMLHADLGIKQELLNLILCYNPLWLRIGLETTYGELLPIQDNSDIYGMSRFIVTRLLGNPDIAAVHSHPTVPNLFGPGYQAALAQFTLKKFLMLVFFLDRAKLTRLIDHDPCLFCKDAQVKSSRDLLLEFSRRYLKGEGDITRHLSFLGYSVTHVQKPLDEFDFAVTKLAVDLRCGVRLSRVVELLTQNWTLSRELRVPAISKLQKVHNVEVAFKMLKERGIDVAGGGLNTRVIVDGHREKTLELLWRIIFHYQVGVMLNEEHIREEIAFLTKNRKLKEKISALKKGSDNGPSNPSLDGPHLYFKSPQLMLLMDWCKAVCSFYDLQIENFTVSFCDGRALCLLVHHYHPSLLPYESINQNTTLMQFQREEREDLNASCESFDGTWSRTFSPSTGKETDQDKLLANERQNFKLLYEKVNELGGVPMMVRSADMSNTIPDEKVVITYVSYLCARLLDLRQETRAARTIQLAWRAHHLKKEQKMRLVCETAANKIQSAVRTFLLKRRHERIGGAVLTIQTALRGYLAKQTAKRLQQERAVQKQVQAATLIQVRRMVVQMKAAITIQSAWRGYHLRQVFQKQRSSAIAVQTYYRKHRAMSDFRKLKEAVLKIQALYRSKISGEAQRAKYRALRDASIVFQKVYRGRLARKDARRVRSAVKIQSAFRGHQQRASYIKLRSSAVLIQVLVKGVQARRKYTLLRKAAMVLQTRYRAVLLGCQVCREYNVKRGAAITIQSAVRCFQERQLFIQTKRNIIIVQAAVRGYLRQKKYRQLRQATVTMQTRYRAVLLGGRLRKEYCIAKGAAITLQAAWKGYTARREFLQQRSAAIKLQSLIRCHLARHRYIQVQKATVILQRRYRALLQSRQAVLDYCYTRGAVITLQAAIRGYLQQKEYLRTRAAIITLQTSTRCYLARNNFTKKKTATTVLQRRFRALVIGRELQADYQRLKAAAITLQAGYRCHVQRVSYIEQRSAAIAIQAEIRKMLARKQYLQLRKATIVLQTRFRARILMQQLTQDYKAKRSSAILLQSLYRGKIQRQIFLRQKSAMVVIQARVRGYLQHRHYMTVQRAVCTIQTHFRSWKTGQACLEEFYLARGRIITIQALYRGYATRKMLNAQKAAATTIQVNFRCYIARTRYSNLKQAVCVLQTRLRAQILALEERKSFQKTRAGIVAIQSLYRGYAQRKELARQHQAATVLQSSYKRFIARSQYLRLQQATLVLQTRYRSLQLGRAVCRYYNVKRGAVITLQAAYRGYSQRLVLSQQRHAAIVIQAAVRGYQASKSYASLRNAAIVVQRLFRANLLRKRICMEYNVMRGAAITLQAVYRGHLQRKALGRQHLAATQIQTRFRGFITRRRYTEVCRAVQVLQTRFRAQKFAKTVQKEYQTMKQAAITLQAAYRGHLQRKALSGQHLAATKIQATFRGFIKRKWYSAVRKSVQVLQIRFRAQKLAQTVQKEYQTTKEAAITLQAAYRGHLQRKALGRQHLAATKIQATFRGFIKRKWYSAVRKSVQVLQIRFRAQKLAQTVQQEYQTTKEAAIMLQAAYRGRLQRKELAGKHLAATRIQAATRGFITRKWYSAVCKSVQVLQIRFRAQKLAQTVQKEYQTTKVAAITLQAAYRGHLQRKALGRQHLAATKIQATFRGFIKRKWYSAVRKSVQVLQIRFRAQKLAQTVQKEYQTTKEAAITLQAAYRGHLQRKALGRQHLAATKIQATFRGFIKRKWYSAVRKSVQVLQIRFRAQKLAQTVQKEYQTTKEAAITLQAAYRGHLQRKALGRQHLAATKIQATFRGFIKRKWYSAVRKSVQVLQIRFRAQKLAQTVQKEYQTTKEAAITLQAAYRGHLQRKALSGQHFAATIIQAAVRGFITRKWYFAVCRAVVILQTRFRASKLAQDIQKEYKIMKGAVITLQAAYRGYCQRKILAHQHLSASKIQASFRGFVARRRYLGVCHAARILQKRFRAVKLGREVQSEYQIKVGALITLQAAFRGHAARKALQRQHEMATRIQTCFRGYVQRIRYHKISTAALVLQRHFRAFRLGESIRGEHGLQRSSAIKIQAFYRCHRERMAFASKKQSAVRIQAMVRGYLGCVHAKKFRQERTIAAIAIQRQWRANALRDQQVRCFNIQRGAAITIQAAARTYLVLQSIKKQHRAATCIQSTFRCHLAVQSYRKTLKAIHVLQDQWRACLLAKKVHEEYLNCKKAAVTVQAVYRGLRVRQRIALEHAAATRIQAMLRQFMARKHYVNQKKAAVVLQRRFRATKSCQIETLKYHLTRGACITLQAAARGFLARRALDKSHRAATVIQSAFRSFKQQQKYKHARTMVIFLQTKIKAYLEGKQVHCEYNAMKSAALAVQSLYRGLVARRLAARHRSARCIQSLFRMHLPRQVYLRQRRSAIKIQAFTRMHLARKSYRRVYGAVCMLQKHVRGYLEAKKTRGDYLQMKSSAIIIQSHLRRRIAERRYRKQRQAAICIQSHYRQMVQCKRYQAIRGAVLVLQRHYRANVIAQETMQEYHMARGAAITLQAVFRGYLQCCRYRNLRCHVILMQARARGAIARRCFVDMVREKEAAVCIQRHVRGYQARKLLEAQRQVRLGELQAFADRTKAHLSIIRLQRTFRNFRLRRVFQQKMDAIITIQTWMRAKLLRLRYRKVQGATLVLQRAARRYLVRKNTAATRLQSVARVWLAKRRVQKMHSAALQMQALWRGHRVRRRIKSKKVNAARARCQRANRNVTEEKKLCNRTASALDYLLHYKSMHRILETLMNLEVVSRLSAICCQHLVEGGAVPVLYVLIRGCNRSVPCMEMIEIIISILLNITKHDFTQHAVLDSEESVTAFLDLLQIYREKNALIFCKTCVILAKLLQDTAHAKIILSCPKTKEKIASLHKLTSRKHAMDERRIKTKTLNASSSFLGASFNSSSVSASFAAGTPRKRRKVLAASGMEWNIEDPMRAIDFLKRMADRV